MLKTKKYAVIDIGSNSIRCMFEGSGNKHSLTMRLGEGLAETGKLDNARAKQSAFVVAEYAKLARSNGFTPLAYATSAVRDAENRNDFIELVKLAAGIGIDVLSGEREAEYAYRAAAKDGGGLIDIGGASMQFSSADFKKSYPIGCVRGRDIALQLTGTNNCDDDFSSQRLALRGYADELISPDFNALNSARFEPLVGVGGSITSLVSLAVDFKNADKRLAHGKSMSYTQLGELIRELCKLESKRSLHPVLAKRHDVILYGAVLLERAMEILDVYEITSSIVDGLDGYLAAAVAGEFEK